MNSYTNTKGEYKDYPNEAENGKHVSHRSGNNVGISIQGGDNCRIVNNIAYIDTGWRGMAISVSNLKQVPVGKNNIIFGVDERVTRTGTGTAEDLKHDIDFDEFATGTVEKDPKFSSVTTFRLAADSPAIGGATESWSPCEDYYGNKRNISDPSVGAVEFNCKDGACGDAVSTGVDRAAIGACYALDKDVADAKKTL